MNNNICLPSSLSIDHIKPMGQYVLLKKQQQPSTVSNNKGGFILPSNVRSDYALFDVISVGPGSINENTGKVVQPTLKKGMQVLFSIHGGTKINVAGSQYCFTREAEILACVDGQ